MRKMSNPLTGKKKTANKQSVLIRQHTTEEYLLQLLYFFLLYIFLSGIMCQLL